jgi:hypothetical protein
MAYPPPPPRRRPIGVTILAILIILAGILFTLVSLFVILIGVVVIPQWGFLGVAIGVIALILALLLLAAGFGLMGLRPWAWWLAVIVLVLYLATQVTTALAGSIGLYTLVLPALILVYLLAVRKHFTSRPAYAPR